MFDESERERIERTAAALGVDPKELAAGLAAVKRRREQAEFDSRLSYAPRQAIIPPPSPPPQNSQPTQPEQAQYPGALNVYPLLLLAAGRGRRCEGEGQNGGGLRAWIFARALSNNGVVGRGELVGYLRHLGIGERKRRRWTSEAIRLGLLVEVRGGEAYKYASATRGAKILGCAYVGERKAELPARELAGSRWRSYAWAGVLAQFRSEYTDKGGNNREWWSPVSRATLARITGVPEQTQRDLERRLPVKYKKNYCITGAPGGSIEQYRQDIDQAAIVRKLKGGDEFIAERKPDIRALPGGVAIKTTRGSAQKINRKLLAAWPSTESPQSDLRVVSSPGDILSGGWPGAGWGLRLFWRDPKSLARKARRVCSSNDHRKPVAEMYFELHPDPGIYWRAGWWGIEAL